MGARRVLRARPDRSGAGSRTRFDHDTLIEAIAVELERDHGFIYVTDDRLVAAVNVSTEDDENFLAELEVELADAEEDDDDDDDDDDERGPSTYQGGPRRLDPTPSSTPRLSAALTLSSAC